MTRRITPHRFFQSHTLNPDKQDALPTASRPLTQAIKSCISCSVIITSIGSAAALAQSLPNQQTQQDPGSLSTNEEAMYQIPAISLTAEGELLADGYRPSRRQASSRLDLPIAETPRSISVVTQQVMKDQLAVTEKDVLKNTSGVASRSEYNGSYSQFSIRGLWANNTYNYLRDGGKFVHLLDPPLFNIERVEVIKGPSAIDFGQVAPGGLINYISKRPEFEPSANLRTTLGSHRYRQAEIDLTGPLGSSETVAYRLTGSISRAGAFTDHIKPEKQGAAGSLTWLASDNTRLELLAEYQDMHTRSYPGLPVPEPERVRSADQVRLQNFYGERALNTDGYMYFLSANLHHEFNEALKGRLMLSHNKTQRDVKLVWPFGGLLEDGTASRGYWTSEGQHYRATTALAELAFNNSVGQVEQQWLVGLDYRLNEAVYGGGVQGSLRPADIFNPTLSGETIPSPTTTAVKRMNANNVGAVIQNRSTLGPYGIILGLRHDRFEDTKANPQLKFGKTQPSLALTYQPTQSDMIYASYAQSFQANSGTRLVGEIAAPPSEGKQFEVGIKQSWLDNRIFTTLSVFDLELTQVPTASPDHPGYSVLTGKQRIKGLELEARGRIHENVELIGQLTLLDPRIASDNNSSVDRNNRVALAVKQTATLWAKYDLPQVQPLWLAGGINYQGNKYTGNDNNWKLPGYSVIDLAAGYDFDNGVQLQLNLKNAANRRYYINGSSNANGFTSVYPGDPRSLYLSLNIPF